MKSFTHRALMLLLLSMLSFLALATVGCSHKPQSNPDPQTGAGAMVTTSGDASHESYVKQQEEILAKQKKESERQQREIEDLERQKLHNNLLRRYESH